MEKELLELRNYCLKRREKAKQQGLICKATKNWEHRNLWNTEKVAFSAVIRRLDQLLKMNSVKPLDERSPTDEPQQVGVSRPNDEAKSKSNYLACEKCGGDIYTLSEYLERKHFKCGSY